MLGAVARPDKAKRRRPPPVEVTVTTDDEPTIDTLARGAYAAYGEVTGGKNYRGEPMPAFDDLGDTIQLAWRHAAVSVVNTMYGVLRQTRPVL